MKIKFAHGVVVDTDNIPADFDEIIKKSFRHFAGTGSKKYPNNIKLLYIDYLRMFLHRAVDTESRVVEITKKFMEHELSRVGEVPDNEKYSVTKLLETCFERGRTNLWADYTGNEDIDEIIRELLYRVVKIVMDYDFEKKQV